MNKSGVNNPNWKGGITFFRNADELLSLSDDAQLLIKERLLSNAVTVEECDCWIWTGPVFSSNGRAKMALGKNHLAYRISYVVFNGKTNDLLVCHTCDNVICINPSHLFLGTSLDNSKDMVTKGRSASGDKNGSRIHPDKLRRGDNHPARINPETRQGEKNGRATLTEEQVREIRRRYVPYTNNHKPSNQKQLAEEFGVLINVIHCIVHGKTWRSVV